MFRRKKELIVTLKLLTRLCLILLLYERKTKVISQKEFQYYMVRLTIPIVWQLTTRALYLMLAV